MGRRKRTRTRTRLDPIVLLTPFPPLISLLSHPFPSLFPLPIAPSLRISRSVPDTLFSLISVIRRSFLALSRPIPSYTAPLLHSIAAHLQLLSPLYSPLLSRSCLYSIAAPLPPLSSISRFKLVPAGRPWPPRAKMMVASNCGRQISRISF